MRSAADEVIHAQLSLQHIHNCQSVRHISAQRWEMCIANINFLMICVAEGSSLVKQADFLITLYNYQLSRQEKNGKTFFGPLLVWLWAASMAFKPKKIVFSSKAPRFLNDTSKILSFLLRWINIENCSAIEPLSFTVCETKRPLPHTMAKQMFSWGFRISCLPAETFYEKCGS